MRINSSLSNSLTIRHGVPQGSILTIGECFNTLKSFQKKKHLLAQRIMCLKKYIEDYIKLLFEKNRGEVHFAVSF